MQVVSICLPNFLSEWQWHTMNSKRKEISVPCLIENDARALLYVNTFTRASVVACLNAVFKSNLLDKNSDGKKDMIYKCHELAHFNIEYEIFTIHFFVRVVVSIVLCSMSIELFYHFFSVVACTP